MSGSVTLMRCVAYLLPLLVSGPLEAQENTAVENRSGDAGPLFISMSYARFSPYGHRIDLLSVAPATERYMAEFQIIPLVIARNDPFGNTTAVSLAPVYQLALPLLIAGEIDLDGKKDDIAHQLVRPLLHLNTRHHLILWTGDRRRLHFISAGLFSPVYMISLFYKHNTDIFIGRHVWMNWSPGAGLNLMARGFQIQIGYNLNLAFDRHRMYTSRWPYIMAGLTAAIL